MNPDLDRSAELFKAEQKKIIKELSKLDDETLMFLCTAVREAFINPEIETTNVKVDLQLDDEDTRLFKAISACMGDVSPREAIEGIFYFGLSQLNNAYKGAVIKTLQTRHK